MARPEDASYGTRNAAAAPFLPALLAASAAACGNAWAADSGGWPTRHAVGDGTEIALIGVYRYDADEFGHDRLPNGADAFADAHANRRKELGVTLRKDGVYDAIVDFEYQNRTWLDTFVRVQSRALLGADYGAWRVGYSKTPVAFEGVTSTRADSFLEPAPPVVAIWEGRRTGIDWAWQRPSYAINLGYYRGQDLLGDNDGTTVAAHAAFTPRNAAGDVLHLGIAASREQREATVDGRGILHPGSARFSAPPGAGLTPTRLVDSGTLADVGHVDRGGLEGLWIAGPWSLQGEVLHASAARNAGKPDFRADGAYLFGSWVLTGESRPYSGGNVGNIHPNNPSGAWELLLRYSRLDLDSGGVAGGREHDWTLAANGYLSDHLKLQANLIRATSERGTLALDPHIVELRVQIQF